jgi:hyperosmotically inducible protein
MRLEAILWSLLLSSTIALGAFAEPTDDLAPGQSGTTAPTDSARQAAIEEDGLARALNDAWITTVVKTRLLRNEEVPGLDVDVDARDGVVTLFGMVPTESAQAAAQLEVMRTGGVHRVENLIEVVPPELRDATRKHDRALEHEIQGRLETRPEIVETDFDVGVCNSVARLRGRIGNEDVRRRLFEAVRETAGVRRVVDQLSVEEARG